MFIGQDEIIKELNIIREEIIKGKNYSMLFVGASGYGKTTLAIRFMNSITTLNNYEYLPPIGYDFSSNRRFHIFDEIHLIEHIESLYPMIDSGKNTNIFITNEYGDVPEPLLNRCIPFVFIPYTPSEMKQILSDRLSQFRLSEEMLNYLGVCTDGVPRKAKILSDRLNYIFKNRSVPRSLRELQNLCQEILGISSNGLDRLQNMYIDYLRVVDKAGIDSISASLRIPKTIILRDIEPGLIYHNMIEITSRGRMIK